MKRLAAWACVALAVGRAAAPAAADDQALLDEARWIWHTRDAAVDRGREHVFAKTFRLDKRRVRRAALRITAEGSYVLSVNGRQVGSDDRWFSLETYDLAPYLVRGANELQVRAVSNTWFAGLFVAGTIELADGKSLRLLSDATWRTWTKEDPAVKQADVLVKGIDGGFWCSVTPMEFPALFHRLNTDLVAPHVAWARPRAGRKIKILAILPRWRQRDVVELIHRLDADVRAVFSDFTAPDRRPPFFRSVKGCLKAEVAANVAAALAGSYDAILLGETSAEVLSGDLQARLQQHVRAGTGLVYSGKLPDKALAAALTAKPLAAAPAMLQEGTPFEVLGDFRVRPTDRPKDFRRAVSLHTCGRGRVVRLGYVRRELLTPPDGADDLHYEGYLSFAIKAILWAARAEPAVALRGFPATVTVRREQRGGGELRFALVGEGAGRRRVDVHLAVRPTRRHVVVPAAPVARPGLGQLARVLRPVHRAVTPVTVQGATPVALRLPDLPAGTYFADVHVRDGKANVNWATAYLTVSSKLRIAALEVSPAWVDFTKSPAPPLSASVKLSQPAPPGAAVELTLIDNYDRVLSRQTQRLPAGASAAAFAAKLPYMPTILGRARAELRVGGQCADVALGRFTAVRRDWDRFAFVAWGHYRGHRGNVLTRLLAGLGLDAYRGRAGSLDFLEIADLAALPGYASMRGKPIDTDPAVVRKEIDRGVELGRQNLPFDPIAYVSGDEATYKGGHELPARLADFRRSLQRQYRTVAALNEQWGTRYASFDDVPAVAGKVEAGFLKAAESTRNYSPVVDQWLENHRVFSERFGLYVDAIRRGDPAARVGTESPLWPWANRCFDWYALTRKLGLFSPYGTDGDIQTYEYGSSFARPGMLLGMTYGGYMYNGFVRRPELADVEFQRWRPWNALVRGYNCVWWYTLGAVLESGVAPGMQPYPAFETACRQIAEIRRGYHTLLSRTRRRHAGIAVHYSVASNVLAARLGEFGLLPWDVHALIRILQDYAPHSYRFVSREQIAAGGLKDYKALILPLSQAIAPDEAEAMARFVRGGGVLIADVRPGLADGHGKVRPGGTVPRLFGVAWDRELGRRTVSADLSGTYGGVRLSGGPGRFPVDPALRLARAKALLTVDGVPLVTSNRLGKGSAVCLNVPFNNYRRYPTPDTMYFYLGDRRHNERMGGLLGGVLAAHGVRRALEVRAPDGRWPWGLEAGFATDGPAAYVHLTKRRAARDEADGQVTVVAPRRGDVYEMFTGRHLGRPGRWDVKLAPADVKLFSILPYRVAGLTVELKAAQARPGGAIEGTVTVETGGAAAVRHVVHLAVVRPDGQAVRYLARNLETQAGRARFTVPLALNAPPGRYTLTFRDVATRTAATAAADVR